MAAILGRVYDAKREVIAFEVMLGAETEWRMYAPAALVTEYDEAGPLRLLCVDDVFNDNDKLDVEGFAEPDYSSEGGDADVEVFEFDGSTWNGGIFGQVASVDATPGSSSITLTGALTGAPWKSDRHHVVVLREWGADAGLELDHAHGGADGRAMEVGPPSRRRAARVGRAGGRVGEALARADLRQGRDAHGRAAWDQVEGAVKFTGEEDEAYFSAMASLGRGDATQDQEDIVCVTHNAQRLGLKMALAKLARW
ncbi:MAG: hypothetical protein ACYTFI_20215, partial [Planctomycetota bacterium]